MGVTCSRWWLGSEEEEEAATEQHPDEAETSLEPHLSTDLPPGPDLQDEETCQVSPTSVGSQNHAGEVADTPSTLVSPVLTRPHPEAGPPSIPIPEPVKAEQVLDEFRQSFITDVDANVIIYQLEYEQIISDGNRKEIESKSSAEQQNLCLHSCLRRTCTKEALMRVCNIVIDVKGNPKMKAFGKKMKGRLDKDPSSSPTEVVTTGTNSPLSVTQRHEGTQQNAVEVCTDLPEPLKRVRRLAYTSYQRLHLGDGPRKELYTMVTVQEGTPKARRKGERDKGKFQLSEGGTKQLTVADFLHKGSQQNRIIYGQPGAGKTVFLKHLCQEVANDELSDFSLILYFPLRDKAVSQALKTNTIPGDSGLESLLQYYISDKTYSGDAVRELLKQQGQDVLIIFDGADEVRGLMDSPEGSLLSSLLEGRMLPQAHFIVSTRPSGCPLLQQHNTPFYEILGFDEEAVESYVSNVFKNKPHKGEEMLSDLKDRPDLMGIAYIPMNLLVFCSIYEHGIEGRLGFPATMTECYKSFIARIVTREKREKEMRTYQIGQSLTNLAPDVKHLLSSLGVLAFKGLTQEPPNYVFQEADVHSVFHFPPNQPLNESSFSGLLHVHASQNPGYFTFSTANFSHERKQEFFAAYHLSLLSEVEQVAFWQKNHQNPKFAVVLRYFAGLTQFQSAVVRDIILATGGNLPSKCDHENPYLLHVFHALFEAQNESLTQSVADQLSNCLTFDLYLTAFDTMVLYNCLSKCKHLTELYTPTLLPHFLHTTSLHHVVQCNPLLHSLAVRVVLFSTEDARALCQAAVSLESFTLEVAGSCTAESLAGIFDHKPLKELDLTVYSTCTVEGDYTVVKKMVALCQLKRLTLFGDSTVLFQVLSGVKDNHSITDLAVLGSVLVGDGSLSDETSSAVATCVQTMQQLATLDIRWIYPLPVLQSLTHRGSPMESVTVNAPPWGELNEEYWAQLEEAASYAQVVKVNMNVYLSVKASRALATGFSKNPSLREVKLVFVPEDSVESVRRKLCTNPALTVNVSDKLAFIT